MSKTKSKKLKTTGTIISVEWSEMGAAAKRKQKFGGHISSWSASKVGDTLYIVPRSVKLEDIDADLLDTLLPSDRAVVMYPYGKNNAGASAMHVRLYGKATADAANFTE